MRRYGWGLLLLIAFPAGAASNDNNVEWFGVRHYYDMRSPEWPAAGESFRLELRVFRGDITAASVRIWDGTETLIPMVWDRNSGDLRYDFWKANVPGTQTAGKTGLYYSFRITDGNDTDLLNRAGMHSGAQARDGDFWIDLSPLANYPLGATVVSGGTVFRLWAPYATRVQVAGSWDGWQGRTDLVRNQGYWTGFVSDARAGHEYRFRLNDTEWWKPDPRGRAMTHSDGNSRIVDPDAYIWQSGGYRMPYHEELVIYELHVGTFSGHNDSVPHYPARYRDLVDAHLDHLRALGINAIELLPIAEFSGDLGWGYNPACQYAIESAYGSPEDFKYLVDRCHAAGIAVLVDVKYNAGGPESNWLASYDSDYNETYYYPLDSPNRRGGGIIGDRYNFNRTEVRDYLIDSARMLLREYRIDGFRLDHTALIKDLPAGGGEGWQFLTELTQTVHATNPSAIVIAEQWPNDAYVTRSVADGGAGCNSQWHEAFKNASLDAFGTIRYPGASANLWSLWGAFVLPVVGLGTAAVNYVESHDEAGCNDPLRDCYGQRLVARTSGNVNDEYAIARAKLAGAAVLLTPGIPMLFMGQEWAEYMVWSVREAHRPNWARKDEMDGVFNFFSAATRVRRAYHALWSNGANNIHHVNDGADVMAMHRYVSGQDVIVVFNFSTTTYTNYRIGFPWDGEYFEILNSDSVHFDGGNAGNAGSVWATWGTYDGLPASAAMTIPRMGCLVFSKTRHTWPTDTPTPTHTPTPTPTRAPQPSPVSLFGCY